MIPRFVELAFLATKLATATGMLVDQVTPLFIEGAFESENTLIC